MSKILRLESENVKRLQVVEITPHGNLVVIGGRNGAGKSSVLDSIEFALGGDPAAKMPVRRGEEKARVVVDMGDLVVKRTFTAAGGTSLVVTNADGAKQSTPQAILDKLVGKLTFDPLAFSREKPKEQAAILRGLIGLDFTAQEIERQKVFDERTTINRDVKALESRIAAAPKHDGLPEQEESAAAIVEEMNAAAKRNAENKALRDKAVVVARSLDAARDAISNYEGLCAEAQTEIDRFTKVLAERKAIMEKHKKELPVFEERLREAQEAVARATDVDLSGFHQRVAAVEQTNSKVRENKQRAELIEQLKAKTASADKLTDKLDRIDMEKRKATMNAKYPVDGLLFDVAGGVTFNGIPLDQCSSAEKLKVSVAVGLSLNPKLRVLLIRDGSLLDDDSMNVLAEMAAKAEAQIWCERVGTDASTSVVIEDGRVAVNGEAM